MQVYMASVAAFSDHNIKEYFLKLQTPEKRERILRLKRNQNAVLLGDILVKYALRDSFGIPIKEQSIIKNAWGKPMLCGVENAHFNVSHSGEWVVCVTAKEPIGVDIEKIRPFNARVAEKICDEKAKMEILSAKNRDEAFCRYWTRQEAAAKYKGTGLSWQTLRTREPCTLVSQKIGDYILSIARL